MTVLQERHLVHACFTKDVYCALMFYKRGIVCMNVLQERFLVQDCFTKKVPCS